MTDTITNQNVGKPPTSGKRERSPSFPYIGLGKAVERARELYDQAKRFDVLVSDAAKAWGMAPKSSSTLMTVAALSAFGLLDDVGGSVETRKVRISEVGARMLGDMRPGVKEGLLAEASLKPKLIAEYYARWGAGRPVEHFAISELKYDKGFNDEGAARFIRVYDETIRFAPKSDSDKPADSDDISGRENAEVERQLGGAQVGDLIQWTSDGVDQFQSPALVAQISEDGNWLWVQGSGTGIPMDQAEVIRRAEASQPNVMVPPPRPPMLAASQSGDLGEKELLRGPLSREVSYRLLISGDLGPREIGKLIRILEAQKAVLEDDEEAAH